MKSNSNVCFSLPGAAASAGVWYFDPNDHTYFAVTSPVHAFSDLFVQGKLRRIALEYLPVSTTADTANPAFSVVWSDTVVASTTLDDFSEIQAAEGSITFPAYMPWRKVISVPQNMIQTMDDTEGTAQLIIMGALYGRSNNSAYGSDKRMGTLFIEYELDLFDMIPNAGASLCSDCGSHCVIRRKQLARDVRRLREAQREKKSDQKLLEELRSLTEVKVEGPPPIREPAELLGLRPVAMKREEGKEDVRVGKQPTESAGPTPNASANRTGWTLLRGST
jgi:hypothetical protein